MKYAIVAIAILAALFCRTFLVSVYKVSSQKMAPNILVGDFILASKSTFGPKHGDLVVFNKNSQTFIKRVIAVGADEVEFVNGEYSINATKCNYTFSEKTADESLSIYEEKCIDSARKIIRLEDINKTIKLSKIKLDKAQVLVANDFRTIENDPNSAEMISDDQIIGKPLFVWMSYSATQDFISKSLGIRWNRILTKLQ